MKKLMHILLSLVMVLLVSCGSEDADPKQNEDEAKTEVVKLKKMDVHEATVERDIMKYIDHCKITDDNYAEMMLKPDLAEEEVTSFLTSDMAFLFRKVPPLVGVSVEIPVDSVTSKFLRVDREDAETFWGIDFGMDDKSWNTFWDKPETKEKSGAFMDEFIKEQ